MDSHTQRYPIGSKHKRWKVPLNIENIQRPNPPFRLDKRRFLKFHLKNGHVISFLCDTGANSNCLTYQDYKKLGKPKLMPSLANLTAANGTHLDTQGLLKLKLSVKGIEQEINFEVSKTVTKSILGEEALSLFRIIKWDLPKNQTENVILSTKTTVIPPGKTALVNCVAGGPEKGISVQPTDILIDSVDPQKFRHVIGIYTGLYHKSKENKLKLKVGNTSSNPITIERGDVLGIYDEILQQPVECFKPDQKQEDIKLNNIPKDLKVSDEKINIPTDPPLTPTQIFEQIDTQHLSDDEREQLKQIVISNVDAFASNKWDIGDFSEWDVELKLKDGAIPTRSRPYLLPEAQQKYLALWVEQMVHAGILERNPSTKWSNPVFVVPKKQPNVFRVVSDMRSVNEMLENDNITTKPITQTIREIQAVNAKFFSVLDVQSAFHAIRYKSGTAEPTSIYVDLP